MDHVVNLFQGTAPTRAGLFNEEDSRANPKPFDLSPLLVAPPFGLARILASQARGLSHLFRINGGDGNQREDLTLGDYRRAIRGVTSTLRRTKLQD